VEAPNPPAFISFKLFASSSANVAAATGSCGAQLAQHQIGGGNVAVRRAAAAALCQVARGRADLGCCASCAAAACRWRRRRLRSCWPKSLNEMKAGVRGFRRVVPASEPGLRLPGFSFWQCGNRRFFFTDATGLWVPAGACHRAAPSRRPFGPDDRGKSSPRCASCIRGPAPAPAAR